MGDYDITSPEDALTDLVKRLLLLNHKLKSQIEDLSQRSSSNKREPKFLQKNSQIKQSSFKILKKGEETPPAFLKSLSVNYDGKGQWVSKNPLIFENENWTIIPSIKRSNDQEICVECKCKEGLEEILNILSVCGFIKKTSDGKVDSPAESTINLIEQNEDISKDLRIKFRKNGSEREFYY